jgi:hypothetical protein
MDEIGLVTNTVQPHNTSTCVTTLRQTTSVSAVQCETPHFFPSGPCAPWVVEPLAPYDYCNPEWPAFDFNTNAYAGDESSSLWEGARVDGVHL